MHGSVTLLRSLFVILRIGLFTACRGLKSNAGQSSTSQITRVFLDQRLRVKRPKRVCVLTALTLSSIFWTLLFEQLAHPANLHPHVQSNYFKSASILAMSVLPFNERPKGDVLVLFDGEY